MNVDYTVAALMFPAIPLLMNVYGNRFHTLSDLIRKIHDEYVWEKHIPHEWEKQLINLSGRVKLLKYTVAFASFGFLLNMLTVFALYFGRIFEARVIFGTCSDPGVTVKSDLTFNFFSIACLAIEAARVISS